MSQKKELLEAVDLFVIDMDGTFYFEDKLIEGAMDFIDVLNYKKKKFMFFTNNTSKAPGEYINRLDRLGCSISEDQLMTAADVTIRYLKTYYAGKTVFLIGTPSLESMFHQAGIRLGKEEADIVLAAFDMSLTYEKLELGCRLIRKGALFLATHPDLNCPVEGGFIPDCGAICAAITASTGKKPKYLGKPHGETSEMIMESTGIPVERTAFVGDRLYTDIAAGVNHGGRGFLVLTGETKLEDLGYASLKPDAVFDSLGEMAEILCS